MSMSLQRVQTALAAGHQQLGLSWSCGTLASQWGHLSWQLSTTSRGAQTARCGCWSGLGSQGYDITTLLPLKGGKQQSKEGRD